jgi:hypothetical protein
MRTESVGNLNGRNLSKDSRIILKWECKLPAFASDNLYPLPQITVKIVLVKHQGMQAYSVWLHALLTSPQDEGE